MILAVLSGCGGKAIVREAAGSGVSYASGERLRARIRDGGGGATFLEGWFDSALDTPCNFLPAKDGRTRCLPWDDQAAAHESTVDFYLDASCTQPVRVFPKDLASVPRFVAGAPTEAPCDGTETDFPVFELGDEVHPTATLNYASSDGTCAPLSDPSSRRVFILGKEVVPDKFVGADRVIEADDGARLGAITLVADDGTREVVGEEDMKRKSECIANVFGLEPGPCIPTRIAWSVGSFSDAACTEPSAYVSAVAPGGSQPDCAAPEIVVGFSHGDACGMHQELFEVGPHRDATYHSSSDGSCNAEPNESGHANFSRGAKLDRASFGQLGTKRVGTGRLVAEYDVTGTRLLKGTGSFYDTVTGQYCNPLPFCDGTTRCLSVSGSFVRLYADDACTKPVVEVSTPTCGGSAATGAVDIAPDAGTESCGVTEGEIVEIGPVTSAPALLFQKTNGTCAASSITVDAGVTWHELGKPVDISTFPKVEERTE